MLSPITVLLLRRWDRVYETARPSSRLKCYSNFSCRTMLNLRQPASVHNAWWRAASSVPLSMVSLAMFWNYSIIPCGSSTPLRLSRNHPIQSSVAWLRHPTSTNATRCPQSDVHKNLIPPFGVTLAFEHQQDPPGVDSTQVSLSLLSSTALDPQHSQRPEDMAVEYPVDYLCPPAASIPSPPACSVCLDRHDDHDDRDNETLLDLRCNTRNVVLDSPCPRTIPHIVITPPVPSLYDYYIPDQNRVDPQWPCYLTVPPLPMQNFEHAIPHLRSRADSDSTGSETRSCSHAKVFSLARLMRMFQASALERLFLPHVHDSLQKHIYKAAAFEACMYAPNVCARFRSTHLADGDKPFTWVDPATPILEAHRHFTGGLNTLIESDHPFAVPHILITDEPPQDPWIAWSNGVGGEQDETLLGVHPHSHMWSYMIPRASCSTPELDLDEEWDSDSDATSLCELQETVCERVLVGPRDAGEFFGEEIEPVDIVDVLPIQLRTPRIQVDDDDDDDLPPFDDWYTSILARSNAKSDLS